ncbi:EF-hand domain-containing protein [Sphingosinicella sp. CPCC 101087]|uniref:EF-hand domain-containing protein n=1 Tax=Sphingosinicella sp. CPCC 101087 TaxID=2497754 RepID=UPI00101D237B|nr:EF-hand domain-containing protein [Sphingosinicella sp. CPCC 101087]
MKRRSTLLPLALFLAAAPATAIQRDGPAMLDRADTNRDGVVTRAEFAAARLATFSRLDRNRDGALSRSDFGRIARRRPEALQRLEAMIAQGDANDDGRLTRAEFERAPMRLFDLADANGDGRIDASERAAARAAAASRR